VHVDRTDSGRIGLSVHRWVVVENLPFNLGVKSYTASAAHAWALAVYHQFSFKFIEIQHVSVLYNQLKTDHLALIPFNLGATFKKRNNIYPLQGQVPV
jgi:hypothetical protein